MEIRTYYDNLWHYFYLLPLHEQMAEINKSIAYYSNIKFPYSNLDRRLSDIKQLKHLKRSIITERVAQLMKDDIIHLIKHYNIESEK